MTSVVLVTGVSRYLGGLLARRLSADPTVERVVGVDVIPPAQEIGDVEFVRADIRNPMIGRVIENAGVDTVVHMNVIATPTFVGGRTPQKEINVIGTMQLLAACQKSSTVRRLVVKSSAAVYGSTPRDPAMFTEDMGAKRTPSGGFGKDSIEVEGYVRGFARRRPDTEILTLRFANIIGPRIRTSITDYFNLPLIPVPLGYDARMQFMHEDDAIDALLLATTGHATGVVNLAGDGVVTVLQAASIVGRPVLPLPLSAAGLVGGLARRVGARLLLASTSEVYGDPEVHPQPEEYWGKVNPIGIRSCYDEGKRCAETLFFDYNRQHNLDIKVVRIFNTYGPRMHPNDGRVVSNFIVQALQGKDITIYGDGQQTRSFCYVDDLIDAMVKMMNSEKGFTGPVNIGNPGEFTMLQLAEAVLKLSGSKSKIIHQPLPSDDPKQRQPNIELAKAKLGWEPKVNLEDGLKETIAYFKKVVG